MKTVTSAGDNSDQPKTFVTNTLEIAVPKGNPGRITGLKDFADADKKIALCAQSVPCGAAAVKVFALAGITPQPDSYETDVSATLQKVAGDEVDAALVYKTDIARADGAVRGHRLRGVAEGGQQLSDLHAEDLQERGRRRPPSSSTCSLRPARRCSPRPASASPEAR